MFLFSLTTLILIFNYLDPYQYRILALSSMILTFILTVSSFFTLLLYFIKKIYYRWRVYLYHVLSSFRQWFFISIFTILLIVFTWLGLPILLWGLLLILIFGFLELFIQNLKDN